MSRSVLHVLSKGDVGGAQRAVFQLASHQHREGDRRVALGFGLDLGPYGELAAEAGVCVIDLEMSSGRDLRAFARARRHLQRFDIHHFHVAEPVLMLASLTCRNVSRVYTHRGGSTSYPGLRALRYKLTGRLISCFDAITGTPQATASVQRVFGIAPEDVLPTFNGIDFSLLAARRTREQMRVEQGVHPATVIIGTAANLRAWKRIDWLIDAAGGLRSSSDWVVWIIGDGPDRPRLEQLAAQSPAADRIRFLGMQLDIADWLRGLDVFVLPSGPVESFGNAVVEAMACELPAVVAADCPAHLQHVAHRATGMVAAGPDGLGAALQELVDDPALRTRLADAGMRFVQRTYTMAQAAESFEAVYRAIELRRRRDERTQGADPHRANIARIVSPTAPPPDVREDATGGSRDDRVAAVRTTLRRRKFASIIAGEIIATELADFLEEHYPGATAEGLLDLGAGLQPYAPLYEQYFSRCVTVDVPHSPHDVSAVDTLASADALPFADAEFDCVVCTEVLEHCRDPRGVMGEIARVLRPGGRVFLTTPFMAALHEMPYDFYRYTPVALEDLARSAGLQTTRIRARGDYVALMVRLLTMPFAKFWYGLSKLTVGGVYSSRNPLLFVTVLAPQLVYLAAWRRLMANPSGLLARVHGRLADYAPGYVTTLAKPGRK